MRLTLLSVLATVASAIPTVEVKGSKLFLSNGNQYFIKGTTSSPQSVTGSQLTDQASRTS